MSINHSSNPKEDRKEFVKEQRTKFKEDPQKFLSEEVFKPTVQLWKKRPFYSLGIFLFWLAIYFVGFGMVQAVNYDMTYCDSSIDEYDGKIMYVYNDWVQYYNEKALYLQGDTYNYPRGEPVNAEEIVKRFNSQHTMNCTYDLSRWNKEPLINRSKTIGYAFWKITTKRK